MKFSNEDYKSFEKFSQYFNEILEEIEKVIIFLKETLNKVDHFPKEMNHTSYAEFIGNFKQKPINRKTPLDYSILAVDGSNFPVNEEIYLPFFGISVASVFEKFGEKPTFDRTSKFKLFYKPQEIFSEDGKLLTKEEINIKMLLEESKFLSKKLEDYKPHYALFDGSLILWGLMSPLKYDPNNVVEFEKFILKAKSLHIPIAGIISGSRSKEIINTLSLYLKENNFEKFVKYRSLINSIFDIQLMDKVLENNSISSLFKVNKYLLKNYSENIYFFFLKTEYEVLRVEIPEFVIDEIDRLSTIVLDQVKKGAGYPVILQLAHQEAVINDEIKAFINNLIFKNYKDKNIFNQKLLSKLRKRI
ncbi:MAG: DNA double-strand break repair nuclease NurA [Caldisericaceae bacterium]